MVTDDGPFRLTGKGVMVTLRLLPNTSRSRIEGVVRLDDGARVLKVRVCDPPEKGKANAALIRLLAKTWRHPKSAIRILSGETDRRKTLVLEGGDAELLATLTRWLEEDRQVAGRT